MSSERASEPRRQRRQRRRLSIPRVLLALGIVAGVVLGAVTLVQGAVERWAKGAEGAWFAPYVDATLVPTFPFEDPSSSGVHDVVLGFVVAERDGGCAPTWGTYVDLDGAATSFDLDRRIARLRAAGGEPIVSFGGAINSELAVRCTSADALASAYGEVIDRYRLTTIDIDVEGDALTDTAANRRRGEAIHALQQKASAGGGSLAVWLTLPVAPAGLPDPAIDVVDQFLASGADLAGVNAMTMNYGGSRPDDQSLADANDAALEAVHQQLGAAYQRTGRTLTPEQLWAKVGATPMIGQNDTPRDRFTLADAERLLSFAKVKQLGRLSMWSSNRDSACGEQMDPKVVSTTCSGVEQEPLDFTHALDGLRGSVAASASAAATTPEGTPRTQVIDDADTSPYPIWQTDRPYVGGEKVVWHQNVYQAKWWTQGDLPDQPVDHVWDTPWRFLGPVLPTDKPAPKPNLPAGTYPAWNPSTVYVKGKRVLYLGLAYEAKWWTQGDTPDPDRPWETPWQPVSAADATSTTTSVVPPLTLPEWDGTTTYVKGDKVALLGVPYEATRWNLGTVPGQTAADAQPAWVELDPQTLTTVATTTEPVTTAVPTTAVVPSG